MKVASSVSHQAINKATKGSFGIYPRLDGHSLGLIVEAGKSNRPVDLLLLAPKVRVLNLSSKADDFYCVDDPIVIPDMQTIVSSKSSPPIGALVFTHAGPGCLAVIGDEGDTTNVCFSVLNGEVIELKNIPYLYVRNWDVVVNHSHSPQIIASVKAP